MSPAAVEITRNEVTPDLQRLRAALGDDRLLPVIGRSGVNVVRDHLFGLDRTRANSLGGKRSHFYAAAARSTHYQPVPGGVVIGISHKGIAQRYHGGTILPIRAKRLAIPATSEAYGKVPSEFDNLEVIAFKSRSGGLTMALAERRATVLRKTKLGFRAARQAGGRIFFWLVKSVFQNPYPAVLPTFDEICLAVQKDLSAYASTVKRTPEGAPPP